MSKNYPEHYERLQKQMYRLGQAQPGVMKAAGQLHKEAMAKGALSPAVKELIALGIGIAVRCEGCITFHVRDAMKAGASREEIVETIGVAVLMGGGPSMVYGSEALAALDQFETQAASKA